MFALNLPTENLFYLVLYLATLVLHVVAMNYVLGGAMVVAGAALFRLFGDYCNATRSIVVAIKDWLPFALGVTITLGVAPILFVQLLYKHAFYTANLLLFHRWMAIVPVLIIAFYLLYVQKSKWMEQRGAGARAVLALGVLVMFLFVAWSWSENHLLSIAGQDVWTEHFAAGRMWSLSDELLPRLSLWVIGSLTTLSVLLAWQLRSSATATIVRRLALIGIVGAGGAIGAGGWYASVLPEGVRTAVTGSSNIVVLAGALLGLVFFSGAWAAMARAGVLSKRLLLVACGNLALAKLCATLLREIRRHVALVETEQWQPAMDATQESARWQGLGVFLLFTLLNLAAISWIVVKVRRQLKNGKVAS